MPLKQPHSGNVKNDDSIMSLVDTILFTISVATSWSYLLTTHTMHFRLGHTKLQPIKSQQIKSSSIESHTIKSKPIKSQSIKSKQTNFN